MRMQVVARGCGLTFHPVFLSEALSPFYLNHFEPPHLLGWFLVKIEHRLERFLGWHEVWMAKHWRSSSPIQTIYEVSADVHKMNLGERVCGQMVCSVNCRQVKKGLMLFSHMLCHLFPKSVNGFLFYIKGYIYSIQPIVFYNLSSYISNFIFP